MERGKGKRCFGFMSDDGAWAHCTREEYAGGLPRQSTSEAFAHLLEGNCDCGSTHNPKPKPAGIKFSKGSPAIAAEYEYFDEQGELIFQVCRRTNPKGFYQRRPDGEGGWINNLEGVRRILYRLPELLHSDESAFVFVCEGEKDVDALHRLGLVATTNSGGAGKWRDEYNEALRNRHVVVLPDNDEAGRNHATQVATSLQGIAASVRVVELPNLPDKGDVSDWLMTGGTAEQLQEIANRAALFKAATASKQQSGIMSARDLLAREFAEAKYAVQGLFSEGVTILAGKPKLGKSWLSLGIAVAVASGGDALGSIPVRQGDVLYLALEDGERRLQDRLQLIIGNGSIPEKLELATQWKRLDEGGLEELEVWLMAHPEARLIVIDTLKRVRPRAKGRAQLYDVDYEAVEPLGNLGRKYGISIAVVHHSRKMESDDPLDLISGSFGLSGAADGAMVLKRARGQVDAVLHSNGRDFEDQELALRWDAAIYGWKMVGDAEEVCLSKERRDVIELLRVEKSITPKKAAQILNRNEGTMRKMMSAMYKDGQIDNDGRGNYSLLIKIKNSNSGNSSNYSHSGNSGNSLFEPANPKQSYLTGYESGNSINDSIHSDLSQRVTAVTTATQKSVQELL
jgi:5S rRNA maturation endonuclease (ribonuclease M5)